MLFNITVRIIFICGLCLSTSLCYGQTKEQPTKNANPKSTYLYLPIHKSQFPKLAQRLNIELKQAKLDQIEVKFADYWHPYQQGLRRGRPGIYLSAPHFSAWAINKHNFQPLLKLNGQLQYFIVSRHSDSHIFEVRDLENKTVCTQAAMSLDFILLRNATKDNILAPKTLRVPSTVQAMRDNRQDCDAFTLSAHLFNEFLLDVPFQFTRLQQSSMFLNYAFVAHPTTPRATQYAVKKFLLRPDIQILLNPVYKLYSSEPKLLNVKLNDYNTNQMKLLLPYWN